MNISPDAFAEAQKKTYSQIVEELDNADLSSLLAMRIVVLRNIMIDPIVPYLRYLAYQMGYFATVVLGEYDNVMQESLGANPTLFEDKTDCVLVFAYLETLAPKLSRSFTMLSANEIENEVNTAQDFIDNALAGIRRQTDGTILWHAFEYPVNPALGILDGQSESGQTSTIAGLNKYLLASLKELSNAFIVDTNACLARLGARSYYDVRYWHIGKAPYARDGLKEIAYEDFKYIRPIKGKNKKCVVLDCDNTLWGGIIGEDGLAGIKLGQTYPGSFYYEFQQEVINLYHKGILVALCSKNNEEDVWAVFDNHPDMLLKKEHIAAAQINWDDKATNLLQIATDLNIGLDSMVFVDDSEFETNLVRAKLPEVEVLPLPKGKGAEYRGILASCGLFDNVTLSDEDKTRGAMYGAERKRQELKESVGKLDDYYTSLGMVLDIRLSDNFTAARIAQQTQKTNQFNLTSKRYTDADIKRFMTERDSDVLYLKLSDIFGDSGLVGTCIVRYEGSTAEIDTLLLSCRVLGRGVEDVFIMEILGFLKKRGFHIANAGYDATTKNKQVEFFYENHGFANIETSSDGVNKKYAIDLRSLDMHRPTYFREINADFA